MQQYEYRAIPAPDRAAKVKGVKDPAARHAHTLSELMNEMAAEGWEYLRADVLPCTERKGLTGTQTVYNTMLVFRRLTADALAEHLAREAEVAQARAAAAAPVATPSPDPDLIPALDAPAAQGEGVFATERDAEMAEAPQDPSRDPSPQAPAFDDGAEPDPHARADHGDAAPEPPAETPVESPSTATDPANVRPLSARVPDGAAPPLVLRRDADQPVTAAQEGEGDRDQGEDPDAPRRRLGWPFTH